MFVVRPQQVPEIAAFAVGKEVPVVVREPQVMAEHEYQRNRRRHHHGEHDERIPGALVASRAGTGTVCDMRVVVPGVCVRRKGLGHVSRSPVVEATSRSSGRDKLEASWCRES